MLQATQVGLSTGTGMPVVIGSWMPLRQYHRYFIGILKWDDYMFLTVLQPFAVHKAQVIFFPF